MDFLDILEKKLNEYVDSTTPVCSISLGLSDEDKKAIELLYHSMDTRGTLVDWNQVFMCWWRNATRNKEKLMVLRLMRDLLILIRAFDVGEKTKADMEKYCKERKIELPSFKSSFDYAKRLSYLPIFTWSYEWETDGSEHVGPMAQTFNALFPKKQPEAPSFPDISSLQTINQTDLLGQLLVGLQELQRQTDSLLASVARLDEITKSMEKK